jgi:hypothetical protein
LKLPKNNVVGYSRSVLGEELLMVSNFQLLLQLFINVNRNIALQRKEMLLIKAIHSRWARLKGFRKAFGKCP